MDFIAVHAGKCLNNHDNFLTIYELIGAGYQKESMKDKYHSLCGAACDAGIREFQAGKSSIEAVQSAIQVLEDSEFTNAGFGSNLTMDGTVECDASLMSGSNMRWAGVASCSNVQNPICVAKRLFDSQDDSRGCGLVSPILLSGEGLKSWAKLQGFDTNHDLISKRSQGHVQDLQKET